MIPPMLLPWQQVLLLLLFDAGLILLFIVKMMKNGVLYFGIPSFIRDIQDFV